MLKYLVILLDDTSTPYCHYANVEEAKQMPIETLRKGILFAMKQNLRIQYILPKTDMPQEYIKQINSMFHDIIGPIEQADVSDVVIIEGLDKLVEFEKVLEVQKRYVVRTTIQDFFDKHDILKKAFAQSISINVVFKDVEAFKDNLIEKYQAILHDLALYVKDLILSGHNINTNLLTDRIALIEMNNCGAGDSVITLAPDGKFYPCPAFYYDKTPYYEIGDIDSGLNIKNQNLYTLKRSPLCSRCDAYHCKRCVWLNKKLTCEVNIPSRQQCVISHIERNASKDLLDEFHQLDVLKEKTIEQINYLDPFDEYKAV